MLPAFILLLMTASTDPPSNERTFDERLVVAVQSFYGSDWETSQRYLDSLATEQPGNTTVHFFNSMIPFWKYFFGGGNDADAKAFLDRSETAINVSERRLRSAPRDTSTVLLLSGLYGYRSLVAASEREYRIAVRSGVTGFTYTRQLLSLNSDDPNALLGRGVFNYMMGSIPREIRWATSFAGMSGDRELGIALIEEAASADSYVSTDALMMLAYLHVRDEEYEKAHEAAVRLIEKHPENVIFQHYFALTAEKTDRKNEALKGYQNVLRLNNASLPSLIANAEERLSLLSGN